MLKLNSPGRFHRHVALVAGIAAVALTPAIASAQQVTTGRWIVGDWIEGNSGVVPRPVELTVPCSAGCRLRFSLVSDTGEETDDVLLVSTNAGQLVGGKVTVASEAVPYPINMAVGVGVIGDTDVEPDEVFKVRVENLLLPKTAEGYPSYDLYAGKIINDDVDLEALAVRGEALANEDELATALRNAQEDGPIRRGFDIGMGAAEGQSLPGPGKQKIHDSLPALEQRGFEIAVSFTLDRNRNAALAASGAAIAAADPLVAAARTTEADPLYWLGFDIATGIFGDPALGAKGNTAKGPGSKGIRDALGDTAKWGFDASTAFHLSREYPR